MQAIFMVQERMRDGLTFDCFYDEAEAHRFIKQLVEMNVARGCAADASDYVVVPKRLCADAGELFGVQVCVCRDTGRIILVEQAYLSNNAPNVWLADMDPPEHNDSRWNELAQGARWVVFAQAKTADEALKKATDFIAAGCPDPRRTP
jgi:hypothetical protein